MPKRTDLENNIYNSVLTIDMSIWNLKKKYKYSIFLFLNFMNFLNCLLEGYERVEV